MAKRPLAGLLPAAGLGTRLRPYRSPKELLPLLLAGGADGDEAIPAPVCHFALRSMRNAEVDHCLVVISEGKWELPRVLGDGREIGVPLGYVMQREALGLTNVVRCVEPWIRDADVLFALPDTVVFPLDALGRLHERRLELSADIMLGVFPTDEPERLAPVEFGDDAIVSKIHDKPEDPPCKNTWGIIAWSSRFTDFCSAWDASRTPKKGTEGNLSHAMDAAREAGLKVCADLVPDGFFGDVGTPAGLAVTIRTLMDRRLVFGV